MKFTQVNKTIKNRIGDVITCPGDTKVVGGGGHLQKAEHTYVGHLQVSESTSLNGRQLMFDDVPPGGHDMYIYAICAG
ncbi:hypothetical protein [Microbispora sp. NPDC046933]|uniref:hypothetical protein n=1 Tax=Microbispora sp. NPDC046933 TaxID=3155618 RepID=UPI0033DDF3CF